MKFKIIVKYIKILLLFITKRTFGCVIYDISSKYPDLEINDLRKLEKLSLKYKKAELDITFLNNCKNYNVIPKFLCYKLPFTTAIDARYIRKKLLKNAIKKRKDEHYKLGKELKRLENYVFTITSSLDRYIISHLIKLNVEKAAHSDNKTHEKKLKGLTNNKTLPFLPSETVMNLSSYHITDEELELLKYGLKHAIQPKRINKTDIFSTFESISRMMIKDLKDEKQSGDLQSKIANMAHNYITSYNPSSETKHKYGIIKRLQNNHNIVITRPDKGSGTIVLDRIKYVNEM